MLNKQTVLGCRHVAGSTACLNVDKFLNVTVTDQDQAQQPEMEVLCQVV